MKYALVVDNEIKEYRNYDFEPVSKVIDGKPMLRKVIVKTVPYDSATQYTIVETIIKDTEVIQQQVAVTRSDKEIEEIKASKVASELPTVHAILIAMLEDRFNNDSSKLEAIYEKYTQLKDKYTTDK